MRSTWTLAAGAFLLSASLAFAAGNPTLEIQSPAQNATVRGNAVRIEFRTRDFKVVSLKNFVTPGAHAAGAASSSDSSSPMSAAQSSAPGQALGGMSPNYSGSTAGSGGNSPESIPTDASGASQPASASSVNPKEGFVVVKIDESPFFLLHTTSDPIMLVFQQAGQHHVSLQLVTDDARPTGQQQVLSFAIAGAGSPPAAPQK